MKTLFVLLILGSSISYAGLCDTEMQKFSAVSAGKKKKICDHFTDGSSFREFKDCISKIAKQYKMSDSELYSSSEKELQGTFTLCSGGLAEESSSPVKIQKASFKDADK